MTDGQGERVAAALEAAYRDERLKVLATIVRQVGGDLTLAEEAVQDAFTQAAAEWPGRGIPDRPGAWLNVTARRRAIDRIRREQTRTGRRAAAEHADQLTRLANEDRANVQSLGNGVTDDRLRLLFTCCHPALSIDARLALTMRVVAGLEVPEIARAFLTTAPTVHQRIVRAKRKIEAAGIPYSVPTGDELIRRTDGVVRVVYLVFNEGHTATASDTAIRADLCAEAVRLARLLVELLPEHAECHGLLALLLLTDARRGGRVDAEGRLVALAEQDRTRWNHDMIDEGRRVLAGAVALDQPGPYQLQAAIAAAHSCAPVADETDWVSIATLYQALERLDPSPVVRINRAIAVANADGPHAGVRLLGTLDADELAGYVPFHAARAELAGRLGDQATAAAEYERAISASTNDAERAALR